MPPITIVDFIFDDDVEEKLARHGVSELDVFAILDGPTRVFRNRGRRRATHVVSGYDRHGRCLLVCIEPTHDPVLWRPVTAWYPDSHHQLSLCP